ncbi:PDR/VanB family oxidoreductase [Pseudoxanthomonas wuyuanensis]|uniref:Vanillate O-demethylase ferredoxin subunit n=1 Tax=Pseudoxanthomonas wuyuanensis TaxID=1073196 RepID=A0A286D813_9GAMM|nr:PDR/VanB family oxidoreductase [Pseudoxanthomonas wuyuanensis]KAF1720168.1 oxidoreductase [Pseudoxanthomonas wuyuanensis]SOD54764.1 vanillate O-demethylase ferredoxin subunit [Pseudoxanthomonas wuyuanensis]
MQLRVSHVSALTPSVRLIRLESTDGQPLPAFEPGSHLALGFDIGHEPTQRKYSLVSDPQGGAYYEIAVKKSPNGRGGSKFLHEKLAVGALLESSSPISEFSIAPDAKHYVLIAGGIGITPMLSIIVRLRQTGASFELHYSSKTRAEVVFQDVLLGEDCDRVTLYFTESDSFRRIDINQLLKTHAQQADAHFYVCGPSTLIDRVRLAAGAHGVQAKRVHFESFGPAWSMTDGPVKLGLSESNIEVDVPVGTTLLDAMEAAGAWVAADCRRGECGACITTYTSGKPIHRDNCLTEEQRAHAFCPCVSWASSLGTLTLQV